MELALGMPVLALLVSMLVQVAAIARDRLAVQLAAREAARAAAASASPVAARAAAEHATTLRPLDVSLVDDGRSVTVTVRHTDHTDMPLIGPLLPDVDLSATVTMAVEPPPARAPPVA